MRSFSPALAGLALALVVTGCGRKTAEEPAGKSASGAAPALESMEQRASYGIGYNLGSSLSRQSDFQPDRTAILAGLEDGMNKAASRVEEKDVQAAFGQLQERANAAQAKAGETNLASAQQFLAQNKTRAGVKETASGLQYEVLRSGSGPKPKESDTVEVHYHGTLTDGTVFDSSVDRGETISFPVNGVIPGWVEALQLMSVGDKWKLTIPPGLAYGPRAAGKIPPNSALIFEVELIAIK